MNPTPPRLTSSEAVLAALRERYPENGYAFLTGVANATGYKANRFADAIVMSLWPSRGLEITGIEVKVSRSDWVRELKNPGKADPLAAYCDLWFLAVGDEAIVQPGELPATWGLLVPGAKNKLCVARAATPNPDVKFDRSILAAILRRFCEQSTGSAKLKQSCEEGRAQGCKEGEANELHRRDVIQRNYESLRANVATFEKASGVNISYGWQLGDIGAAVRSIVNGTHTKEVQRLRHLLTNARHIVTTIEGELAKIEPPSAPATPA